MVKRKYYTEEERKEAKALYNKNYDKNIRKKRILSAEEKEKQKEATRK
jgi:hypothetical protein